jgi:predicted 3-demethylubiquinone-9 3-methyltransferase (glyoxalase superfamily)
MADLQTITPCLWFDRNAEEAANYYCSVFENSSIITISHYPNDGLADFQKDRAGEVLTVQFELNGQRFLALNGGPDFTFSEAISMMVDCKDQSEIDYFWSKLSAVPQAEMCGWCKDKFGLSWQITPEQYMATMNPNQFAAMMQMKKIDIAELEAAK